MDGKLQVIAGILALFFLGVATAKSLIQRARKREEAARRVAASKESQEVSLHNPFAAEEETATGDPATPQGGRGKMGDADENGKRTTASGKMEGAEAGESGEAGSIYKWE